MRNMAKTWRQFSHVEIRLPKKRKADDVPVNVPNNSERLLREELDRVYKDLKELEAKIRTLQEEVEDQKATSQARKNTIQDLQTVIIGKDQTIELLREEVKSAIELKENAIHQYQILTNTARSESKDVQSKQSSMQITLDTLHANKEALEKTNRVLASELSDLRASKISDHASLVKKDTYISRLHREGDQLEQKVRDAEKKMKELNTALDDAVNHYSTLENRCESLRNELLESRAQNEQLEKKLRDQTAEYSTNLLSLASVSNREPKYADLQARNEQLERDLEAIRPSTSFSMEEDILLPGI